MKQRFAAIWFFLKSMSLCLVIAIGYTVGITIWQLWSESPPQIKPATELTIPLPLTMQDIETASAKVMPKPAALPRLHLAATGTAFNPLTPQHSLAPLVDLVAKTGFLGYPAVHLIDSRALLMIFKKNLQYSIALAFIIFVIFYFSVLRHVHTMSRHLRSLDLNKLETLQPISVGHWMSSEIFSSKNQINKIQSEVLSQFEKRFNAEKRLNDLNLSLENEVRNRIAENEQQRSQIEEKARLSLIGEMAGGIAHEINNPLTIVYGYASILKKLSANAEINTTRVQRIAGKIEQTAERISRVINGLMNLSREPEPHQRGAFDVDKVVRDTIAISNERFASKRIQVHVDYPITRLRTICHRRDLGQILLNLLNNSQYALRSVENPWIKIGIAATSCGTVCLTVTDNGHGIPSDIRNKVLTPFFTTKPAGTGAGLGLSVSKAIAERYSGSLSLDHKSIYTRFILELPLKSKPAI